MKKDKASLAGIDPINVLLIDDNAIDNYIHKKRFEYRGKFHCDVFHSAVAALEHLRQTKIRYDYIVLDIYMPGMDGFSFVEHFNRLLLNKEHGHLVILTVSLNPVDRIKAADLGLAFMEKPFRIEKLFDLR